MPASVFPVRSIPTKEKSGPEDHGKQLVDQASLIHQVRGPAVAAWDLKLPELGTGKQPKVAPENVRVRTARYQFGSLEKRIGPVDKRTQVKQADIQPGGKYRSIVKLFLHFAKSEPGQWDIATGWLIRPDLLVTAGHCAYDWDDSCQYLTSVKAYIGYSGKSSVNSPDVQFRSGKRVAVPTQWLLNAEEHHDVAFIQLSEPFHNVKPFDFEDTPKLGDDMLGVVGYPGDLQDGHVMYEGWFKTAWDITKTNRFLEYQIDTEGGNSGSPVLMQSTNKSIGVHVLGGSFANSATVIGVMGNVFSYYIEAIGLSLGIESSSKAKLSAPSTSVPVANFAYITFPGTESISSGAELTNGDAGISFPHDVPSTEVGHTGESAGSSSDFHRTIDFLRAQKIAFSVDSNGCITIGSRGGSVESGRDPMERELARIRKGVQHGSVGEKFIELPDSLDARSAEHMRHSREAGKVTDLPDGPLPDQSEFQTTWFIGFPEGGLQNEALAAQIALKKNVGIFWADATTKVEATVQAKIKESKLDPKNLIAVSSFRAKCFDNYIRRVATCIQAGAELTKKMELHVKRVDFHTGILLAILEGIAVPATAFAQLERVVASVGKSVVSAGTEDRKAQLTFWVSMTTYHVEPDTNQVSTKLRTVFFQSNDTTYTVTAGKSGFQEIDFVLEYQQYDATFNNDIFAPVAGDVQAGLVEKMKVNMAQSILDVDV